ncbi:Rz-like spanin [Pseudomonas phage vB_PaeP_MAG4]|uniref:DUF2514 domain-containing protein n=1 Tax=Pseudomonas phage vB_PaeP_MAG4 TaxID=1639814 RepID=A0A172B2L2_9CAUD|nr:Rz-like spanin [Pseudomonas phage vB_PaeP_MAG4]AKH49494.1 hypothetical protein vB_PaeP_fi6_051 [Pseudomonas phage vB_PaeP_MAG4]
MTISARQIRWIAEVLLFAIIALYAYNKGFVKAETKTNAEWELRMMQAERTAEENKKAIEQSLLEAMNEVKKDADEQLADQASRIAAADAQSRSLREQVARLRDDLIADGARATTERHASNAASVVLADLYGSCVSHRQELAGALDRSHAAGLTCQKSYAIVKSLGHAPPQ